VSFWSWPRAGELTGAPLLQETFLLALDKALQRQFSLM